MKWFTGGTVSFLRRWRSMGWSAPWGEVEKAESKSSEEDYLLASWSSGDPWSFSKVWFLNFLLLPDGSLWEKRNTGVFCSFSQGPSSWQAFRKLRLEANIPILFSYDFTDLEGFEVTRVWWVEWMGNEIIKTNHSTEKLGSIQKHLLAGIGELTK